MNELLGMTAHDLRGPMGTIGSLAQILHQRAADRLDDTERMVHEQVVRTAVELAELVEREGHPHRGHPAAGTRGGSGSDVTPGA